MYNEKLKAAIYGLAVGDALGVPVEFKKRGTFSITTMTGYGTYSQPAGTWSDDTSMTLATCDSIRARGRVDAEDIQQRFRNWLYDGEYAIEGNVFDVGGTTARALRSGKGESGEHSNGNGSLMRILPLAFTEADNDTIAQVSAITHAHNLSKSICIDYIALARELIMGNDIVSALSFISRTDGITKISEKEIRSSGYVADTFQAAVWCISTTNSYKDAVLRAVNLGDDTDTTAAVTGGLAGIVYGLEAIPQEWLDTLRGKDIIERCLF